MGSREAGQRSRPRLLEEVKVRDLVELTTRCGLIGADASGGNLRVEIVFALNGMAGETASSISTRCSSVAPEYSLWGNARGTTKRIRSRQRLAASASSMCAIVGGLKLPANIPTLRGLPEVWR